MLLNSAKINKNHKLCYYLDSYEENCVNWEKGDWG
jgi:hypothetical protein